MKIKGRKNLPKVLVLVFANMNLHNHRNKKVQAFPQTQDKKIQTSSNPCTGTFILLPTPFAYNRLQSKMNRKIVVFVLALLSGATTFSQPDSTLVAKNKNIVIAMNELFNQFKPDAAEAYFSDSLVKFGTVNGKSFFRAMQEDIQQTFPDVQTKIRTIWADGDWIIADCIFSGTHKGIAMLPHHGGLLIGKTPSGKSFSVQHIRMYRIVDGKIRERKAVRDDVGMYQQLGLLPPSPNFRP